MEPVAPTSLLALAVLGDDNSNLSCCLAWCLALIVVGMLKKGFTFGVSRQDQSLTHSSPGPIYKIGCTTLGVAAAEPMVQKEIDRIAVL